MDEVSIVRHALKGLHGQLPGSLELAYLGDTVYDLYVRSRLVMTGGKINQLHREAVKRVNAHAQSEVLRELMGMLTDAEADVVRRARNVRQHKPKNADASEYQQATAVEALLGYLSVTGQFDRLYEIMDVISVHWLDEGIKEE